MEKWKLEWKDLKGVDKMSNRDGSSVPIQKCKMQVYEKSKVDFNKNKKVSFNIEEPPITPSGSVLPTKDPTSVIAVTNSSLKWTVQQVRDTYFLRFCFLVEVT